MFHPALPGWNLPRKREDAPGAPAYSSAARICGVGFGPQKRAPPGLFRYKTGCFRRGAFCLKNRKDFRLCKNAHPGLWGYEGSTSLYRGRKKNVLRT